MKQQEALKLVKGMLVTITTDKERLKAHSIATEHAGAPALVYTNETGSNNRVAITTSGASNFWINPEDLSLPDGIKLDPALRPAKFGKTDIEKLRTEGGNKALKSAMDERLNTARGHLQNAGSLEKHNKEMALAREQVRQVNLLFRAIKKV